ncbi:glycine--tRNA ligase subunit beta [Acetobacter orleanensis]|uniref:Glycine--tRNA ligase beta subunit n=1 Tax=Acetobacter orleanensis TaxID=104099 RepID=A0A4Y3TMZ0_9PROT|nr:glycine--tRNA ligase subunit beta [Acetobacter orleanensis]KXV64662.1 glycyl-tRNA synthetase subunit beta [Acetobacter orleanensis]PCD78951.1 glycine--tRNA ligase subunit beta [Acetobacter orleanensis]GAN67831.1 glycyl-tRNA synthetase subunit beta [Acetobacter orleanensis JCM 7639]GBR31664.1 glycyl-tRNA synthetase subunit beta [Acetobacter orleanensis NRIC 0473]GEB83168.1 glycine--tRNA ligase beta subunit [Acetobacter orleanensis]
MPELLIELFSEEIPARMQQQAGETLLRLLSDALAPLNPKDAVAYTGPRRIAASCTLDASVPGRTVSERGPREGAPEKALEGFTRKHGVTQDALTLQNGFWVLERDEPALSAKAHLATIMPDLLRRFPWPKSMRWGQGSAFTWVRPLRRILCLLDGETVPFSLALSGTQGDDNGHHLQSGNQTEGHRFLSPGAVAVSSVADWQDTLKTRHVQVHAADRREAIVKGLTALATAEGLALVPDTGLVDEVAGLVEWPVPFLGRIDEKYMDLPAEVMQVSMRVNQRYFALRNGDGSAAPRFAFVANIVPADDGTLIVTGNERVLRARFADARHFWDLDRKQTLASRLGALDAITFHAKLGSQGERTRRMVRLAGLIAPMIGASKAECERAAELSKTDLTTGMVGEFPELQGVMGGYYAQHDGEAPAVCQAITEQYMPRSPGDTVPTAPVSIVLGLADRFDMLAAFFAAGEKPSGSGDPFGLRRAALGIIRLIRENSLRLDLVKLFLLAAEALPESLRDAPDLALLPQFMAERLRVQLRSEGARYDCLAAISTGNTDTDITRLLARAQALETMLETEDGKNLLAATRRAANILRIEDRKDGPHEGAPDATLFAQPEEQALAATLDRVEPAVEKAFAEERFTDAMREAASLRAPLDQFFEAVTVNAPEAPLRLNRLRLLARLGRMMRLIADFSQIEG